jgi:asparagine synthase (glutamine-hydrolysing)
MLSPSASVISYNGEIYNHKSLRAQLSAEWRFKSSSDTEVLLAGYQAKGARFLDELRGMFSFAIWDETAKTLFCARDRFGIKPFYYTVNDGILYFASEMKALLPFVDEIGTNLESLAEYLAFQYTLGDKTLFQDIYELPPAHYLEVTEGKLKIEKYWDVKFDVDFDKSETEFAAEIAAITARAVAENLAGDVEIGAYVSGGIDSSLVYLLANEADPNVSQTFHGRFTEYPGFDESEFARGVADCTGQTLNLLDITANDFESSISSVVYHLDTPVAGPGSFPQFMVSAFAAESVKVVLGGQGGDEIFGGYARYVIAYLEQCLAAAIDGTYNDGRFVVTLESVIPNLGILREYKPLIKSFWSSNLFGPLEQRYFDLLNRAGDISEFLSPGVIDTDRLYESFLSRFRAPESVAKEAYLDSMMHFDFKNLLPALLHVEDRMSMAHGLESRVPLLDHELVELMASVPADKKFAGGESKRMLKRTFSQVLPEKIRDRRDKMGFPVPLSEWANKELSPYLHDVFSSKKSKERDYLSEGRDITLLTREKSFSRKNWVLLSLELWHQRFHDASSSWKFSQ